MVPRGARREIMRKLHASHLAPESMLKLARRSFFWPKMAKDLRQFYLECEQCATHQQAKVDKACKVIPEDLTLIAPAEEIAMDHFMYKKKYFLAIKDRASGLLYFEMVEDTTTDSSVRLLLNISYTFGYPHKVKMDGAGNFRHSFTSILKGHGMEHIKSSAHHAKSNGNIESSVKSLKHVIKHDGKVPSTCVRVPPCEP